MALPSNVKMFTGVTPKDFDADIVLQAATEQGLKHVVIIGEKEDGVEWFSSSAGDGPLVLWMLERAKMKLLTTVDPYED